MPRAQILVEQQQIIAEVVVCLAIITLRKRGATDVEDLARRLRPDAPAVRLHAPAQIDLFHVHDKVLIEQPDLIQSLLPNRHRRTACPEYVSSVIVLMIVSFHLEKDAPACEGISKPVDETSGRTCILESVAVRILEQFRLNNADILLLVEHVYDRVQPLGRNLHVIVEEDDHVARGVRNGFIIPAAEGPVFRMLNDLDFRIVLLHPGGRWVG